MIKRTSLLLLFLVLLSCLSGYQMSKASWVGRVGMSLFYKQYNFLKIWWQGALAVLGGLLVIFILTTITRQALKPVSAIMANIVSMLLALGGLYFTYMDFRHDFSHRLLGEPFHTGIYLFWIGWISISLFYLINQKKAPETFPIDPGAPKKNAG